MGGRNKRRNKKMDKHKFKIAVCKACDICAYGFKPKFCFNKLYKKNPSKFMSHVPEMLVNQNGIMASIAEADDVGSGIGAACFRKVFCEADCCNGCEASAHIVMKCMNLFKLQAAAENINNKSLIVSRPKNSGKRTWGRKRQKKVKVVPTVTVIMSDNEDFRKEVSRILANNVEQSNQNRKTEQHA